MMIPPLGCVAVPSPKKKLTNASRPPPTPTTAELGVLLAEAAANVLVGNAEAAGLTAEDGAAESALARPAGTAAATRFDGAGAVPPPWSGFVVATEVSAAGLLRALATDPRAEGVCAE
ncbi:hypothetical protein B1R94_05880 [Mycolicibacterium litorale]|nr:hypothetical protein B1R94_05880 [Mycolicibacterium litorale]